MRLRCCEYVGAASVSEIRMLDTGSISTIGDAVSEKRFIRKPVRYERKVQRVSAMDMLKYSGNKRTRYVLVYGDREDCGGLSFARVLVAFTISVKGSNKSQEYAIL